MKKIVCNFNLFDTIARIVDEKGNEKEVKFD